MSERKQRTIYDLALELLEKYEESEQQNIRERSSNIDLDTQTFDAEIERYRAEIERLRGTGQ